MLLRSTEYDPVSKVLVARWSTPSGAQWTAVEYADVPAAVVDRLLAARPHARLVLDAEVTPRHPHRRRGERDWVGPDVAPLTP